MAADEVMKTALVGDNGTGVSLGLLLALKSLTVWPVDAFAVDLKDIRNQSVVWVQGNAIGMVTGTDNFDEPTLKASVRPLGSIVSVDFEPRFIDKSPSPSVDRAMTVMFSSGEPIKVDVGKYLSPHYRDRANELINAVLRAVAGSNRD
jgi:hypothetical protein